jgi:DNA-nicking Smr family endonuclease
MSRRRPSRRKAAADDGGGPSDDATVWQHIASSVEPLKKAKLRVSDVGRPERGAPPTPAWPATPVTATSSPPAGEPKPRVPRTAAPPPLAEFERRSARRVASGHTEIEARLDLHGARQDEAHRRLAGFLASCSAEGMTMVLVITGKGGRAMRTDDLAGTVMDRAERGVLRRLVPIWLAEPALRGFVVSYTAAALKHGGDGAFYVRLRRRQAAR